VRLTACHRLIHLFGRVLHAIGDARVGAFPTALFAPEIPALGDRAQAVLCYDNDDGFLLAFLGSGRCCYVDCHGHRALHHRGTVDAIYGLIA
jgi:hypothetical protein